jgi:hypothetical protein
MLQAKVEAAPGKSIVVKFPCPRTFDAVPSAKLSAKT